MINVTICSTTLQTMLKRAGIMATDITDVMLDINDNVMSFNAVSISRDKLVSGSTRVDGDDAKIPIGNIVTVCDLVGGSAEKSKKGFKPGTTIHISTEENRLILCDVDSIKRYEVPFTNDNVILSKSSMTVKREGEELFIWSVKQKEWSPMGKIGAAFTIPDKGKLKDLLKEGVFQEELRLIITPTEVTLSSKSEDTTGVDRIEVDIIKPVNKDIIGATFTNFGELLIPLLGAAKDSDLTCFLIHETLLYVEEIRPNGDVYRYTLMARAAE